MASVDFNTTLSSGTRLTIFVALNALMCLAIPLGAAMRGGSTAELAYVLVLFALCSSPILFMERPNGAYGMLGIATAAYFVTFGLADVLSVFVPAKEQAVQSGPDPADPIVLLGALMQIMGFHIAARLMLGRDPAIEPKDWPQRFLPLVGTALWALAAVTALIQALYLQQNNSDAAVGAAFSTLGRWGTMFFLLGSSYAGPLGIIVLGYWWARWDSGRATRFILLIIAAQFVIGWVVDTKEVAINAPIELLLTRWVIRGRIPVRWWVGAALGIVLVFPVLTAKREVVGEMNLTRAQALPHTMQIIGSALHQAFGSHSGDGSDASPQGFLQRVSNKGAVSLFAQHVGKDQPYKDGETLLPLVYAFIPRIVWPDKPAGNAAETFNRDFHLSDDPDTHISPTHLGEMYWNFGYAGVFFGELLAGLILGFIAKRFDPSTQASLTRVLVIIVTLYELMVRQEGSIGLQYVGWVRALLLIGFLHLVMARRAVAQITPREAGEPAVESVPGLEQFPNLLR